MKKYKFFEKYLNDIMGHLSINTENNSKLVSISKIFKTANLKKKKLFF